MDVEAVRRATAELDGSLAALLAADLEALEAEDLLSVVGDVEGVARRLDAFRVRIAGTLDRTGAHTVDGHRTAKAALRHLGRLSGPEAHRRVTTARALRSLPQVAAAFERGSVPTEMVHAIGRAASNRRVGPLLPVADPVFAEQAEGEAHDDFVAWLAEWERLADADGADQDEEEAHRRRSVSLVQNQIDGSWLLRGQFGAVQGAVLADTLAAFVAAEDQADRDEALERVGPDATAEQWARSGAQRRADALVALVRAAWESPGRAGQPLVNIVVDQDSFEEMIRRRVAPPGSRPPTSARSPDRLPDPSGRLCATTSGHRVSPHDALSAALVGHVRRVVVDGHGRVVDLGRKSRLFTGGAKEAAELSAAIAARGPTICLWSGCTASNRWLQVDHATGWTQGGCTDQDNANLLCGHHNRLKESGYRPVRGPDGSWRLLRPDGTEITPPV